MRGRAGGRGGRSRLLLARVGSSDRGEIGFDLQEAASRFCLPVDKAEAGAWEEAVAVSWGEKGWLGWVAGG